MNRKGDIKAIVFAILVLLTTVPSAAAEITVNQTLGFGWNLVGVPSNGFSMSPSEYAEGLQGVVIIRSVDDLFYDPALPDSVNTLKSLESGKAFWIYINNPEKQNKTLDVLETLEVKLTLHPGENYIFTPFYMVDILCSKFAQDIKGVRIIHTYNSETAEWLLYDPAMPEFLDDFWSIRAGTAYRIYVDYPTDQVITLPVENPKPAKPAPLVTFEVSNAIGRNGESVSVYVNLTSRLPEDSIAAIRLSLVYDHSVIKLNNVEKGYITSGWQFKAGDDSMPNVSLVYPGIGTAITGGTSGSVAILNFSVLGEPGMQTAVNISSLEISNAYGDVEEVKEGTNGVFTVRD